MLFRKTVKIKYHGGVERVQRIKVGDWIDLRSSRTTILDAGEFKLIPLGISMQLPKGYEAHVVPRSSTYKKYGIIMANSVGIIDNSYCGDDDIWQFPAIAIRKTVIPRNERICQFRIVKKQPNIHFQEVQFLGNKNRGGFGSTGSK